MDKIDPLNQKMKTPAQAHTLYFDVGRGSIKIVGSKRSYYWEYGLEEGGYKINKSPVIKCILILGSRKKSSSLPGH